MHQARNKVLALLGYGCVRSYADRELLAFVEKFQIPFMTTMDGKGVLPEDHPLWLGTTGVSGDLGAKRGFKDAEVVLAMGNSFAKWSTWEFEKGIYDKKTLLHINIDPHEIGKVYHPDFYMVSDVKLATVGLIEALEKRVSVLEKAKPFIDRFALEQIEHTGDKIHPGQLVQEISKLLPENSIILGDAGGR